MKYIEFKKLMEDKGFEVDVSKDRTIVHNREGDICGWVSNTLPETVDMTWEYYHDLPKKLRRFVGQKCFELAFTDLEDREGKGDEKYYYKLSGFSNKYLNKSITKTGVVYDVLPMPNKEEITESGTEYRTLFTDREFKGFPKEVKNHKWEKINERDL